MTVKRYRAPNRLTFSGCLASSWLFIGIFVLLGIGAVALPLWQATTTRPDTRAQATLSQFGVEINRGSVARTISLAREANIAWARYNGILWTEVETTRGARNWSVLLSVENELRILAEQGITPVVIVRTVPTWAQRIPGVMCGPIAPQALDDFASFMHDLVARYSVAPYHVRYWELWNEPDVAPPLVAETMPYGCWGNTSDPYYGGGDFAAMLKRVYPAIKQADPQAQVVLGGLSLDCDPTNPPAGKDCTPGNFFEGVLQHGGGQAFDILAYHSYVYWGTSNQDPERTEANWQHRGGALLGRLDFLRTMMQKYAINKPIVLNEGGLLCWQSDPACFDGGFLESQAIYLVRYYARARANGLLGAAWYTLNDSGWNESGLMGRGGAVRPAYHTLKFMANLLKNADYIGTIATGALEGYVFHVATRRYQVYWTNDGSRADLSLPPFTRVVYNMYGHGITPGGSSVMVGNAPIFLEIRP